MRRYFASKEGDKKWHLTRVKNRSENTSNQKKSGRFCESAQKRWPIGDGVEPGPNSENMAASLSTRLRKSNAIPATTRKHMSGDLTVALLAWRKNRRNHRLLFGHPFKLVRLDWQRSLAAFKPGNVFAYERWIANKYGTQHWSIHVLQAQQPGQEISKIPGLKPGAKILTQAYGKEASKRLLNALDPLKATNSFESLQIEEWNILGHRLSAGANPEFVLEDLRL